MSMEQRGFDDFQKESQRIFGIGFGAAGLQNAKMRLAAVFAAAQVLAFLFSGPVLGNGDAPSIKLTFHDHALSAVIEKASLPDVVARIEAARDIWVRGMDRVPPVEYSVEFEDMPLDEGMERILSPANHCLVFNEKGELEGIIFLTSPGTVSKKADAGTPKPQQAQRWTPAGRSHSKYYSRRRSPRPSIPAGTPGRNAGRFPK
jgi:hypothetical protein